MKLTTGTAVAKAPAAAATGDLALDAASLEFKIQELDREIQVLKEKKRNYASLLEIRLTTKAKE